MASGPKQIAQMIGQVEEVSRLLNGIVAVSTSRIPVLLLGPRSTGIDLLAKCIHVCSPREARPFVSVRCGLYPAATVEAQLMGKTRSRRSHVRQNGGAAVGLLAAANSGTLFVDQIQNTSPQIQSELLRVVTDGEYVDSEGITHRTDIRLIVSAWHDLKQRAEEGRFHTEFFERLSRVSLLLRKGSSDQERILEVVDLFRTKASGDSETARNGFRINEAMREHEWSEEIETLKYAIRETSAQEPVDTGAEAILMATLRKLGHQKAQSLAQQNLQAASAAVERCVEAYETFDGQLYETLLSQLQRTLIERVMIQCNGTISRAAAILGVSNHLLQTKIRELGLEV